MTDMLNMRMSHPEKMGYLSCCKEVAKENIQPQRMEYALLQEHTQAETLS